MRELVGSLTLERKADLVVGVGLWWTHTVPELGLEPLQLSDGPNGVRGVAVDERDMSLCTPCGTAIAASWDVELARRVGELLGDEAVRRGVHVVLGPTINIHRSPLGGRGFECLSEDPLLSGLVAAGWIRGVQSRGVAATPKHFVCNEAESKRTTVDNVVGDRALREIYLLPFELAAKAGAWAMMTAYNRINGHCASASEPLVRGVLKGEWRWDGLVMSDWYAHGDTVGSANAGLDLEMPGPARLFGALADAVRTGAVDEAVLDDKVIRLLTLASRVGRLDGVEPRRDGASPGSRDRHLAVLAEAAAAGFVLLKNDRRLLPLDPTGLRRLAVIGPGAADPCYQGGGSAAVNLEPVRSVLDAVIDRYGETVEVVHEPGCSTGVGFPGLHLLDVRAPHEPGTQGLAIDYFTDDEHGEPAAREFRSTSTLWWPGELPGLGRGSAGLVRASALFTPVDDGDHLFSLQGSGPCRIMIEGDEVATFVPSSTDPFFVDFDHERSDASVPLKAGRTVLVELEMTIAPNDVHTLRFGCLPPVAPASALLDRAVRAAAGADAVVLVVGTTHDIEHEGADRTTTTLPAGQDTLVRSVLAANPATAVVVNAGSEIDMPWADSAATLLYAWFPGQEFGTALADVLTGEREPGGRLPFTIGRGPENYPAWDVTPDASGQVHYRESIFVGYRHFDRSAIEPRFCFGHGLGYGQFDYERLEPSTRELVPGRPFTVDVTVRNAGARRAKEIVQLYVHDLAAAVPRPVRELKAFAAVVLDPGELRTVRLELDLRAFSYWDEENGAWRADAGAFDIQVGRSSRDIRLTAEVTLLEP